MWWNRGMHLPEEWVRYFKRNAAAVRSIPWDDPYRLSPRERVVLAHSIRQFQLGERSTGRCLEARAVRWLRRRKDDRRILDAIRAFVAEESRSGDELGRFLDIEGIPRLKRHWLEMTFRSLRRLGGFETEVRVLAAAEIISLSYYRALREATQSPILREIARLILRDKAAHLRFHASNLARFAGPLDALKRAAQLVFLVGTVMAVWIEHRSVLVAGGYRLRTFLFESLAHEGRLVDLGRQDAAARAAAKEPAAGP